MLRFPTRTLVLMGLTLLAFGWLWWQTHVPVAPPGGPVRAKLVTPRIEVEVTREGGDR